MIGVGYMCRVLDIEIRDTKVVPRDTKVVHKSR